MISFGKLLWISLEHLRILFLLKYSSFLGDFKSFLYGFLEFFIVNQICMKSSASLILSSDFMSFTHYKNSNINNVRIPNISFFLLNIYHRIIFASTYVHCAIFKLIRRRFMFWFFIPIIIYEWQHEKNPNMSLLTHFHEMCWYKIDK